MSGLTAREKELICRMCDIAGAQEWGTGDYEGWTQEDIEAVAVIKEKLAPPIARPRVYKPRARPLKFEGRTPEPDWASNYVVKSFSNKDLCHLAPPYDPYARALCGANVSRTRAAWEETLLGFSLCGDCAARAQAAP
jgi:hypothetical protein